MDELPPTLAKGAPKRAGTGRAAPRRPNRKPAGPKPVASATAAPDGIEHWETQPVIALDDPGPAVESENAISAELTASGGAWLWDTSNDKTRFFVLPNPTNPHLAQLFAIAIEKGEIAEGATRKLIRPVPNVTARVRTQDGHFLYYMHSCNPSTCPSGRCNPVLVSAEDVDRGRVFNRTSVKPPTGASMVGRVKEAIYALGNLRDVEDVEPELPEDGKVVLPRRGVQPLGYQDIRGPADMGLIAWRKWAAIAEHQSSNIPAIIAGVVVAGHYARDLSLQNTVVDLNGTLIGCGKTTVLESVAAMLGNPAHTCRSMNSTLLAVNEYAGSVILGVVIMDESHTSSDKDFARRASMLSAFTQGARRARVAASNEGVRNGHAFHGNLLLSGNIPFIPDEIITKDSTGLRRRYFVIEVTQDYKATDNETDADNLKALSRAGYGHLIPAVLDAVTVPMFEKLYHAELKGLRDVFGGEDSRIQPEILKVFAGYIAGAEALDRVLGSQLGASARRFAARHFESRDLSNRPLDEVFLASVREHISQYPDRWIFPAAYAWSRVNDIDAFEKFVGTAPTFHVPHIIAGVRWEDGTRFALPSEAQFRALCDYAGIADPEAARTALIESGALRVPPSARAAKRYAGPVTLVHGTGIRPGWARPKLYDFQVRWDELDLEDNDPGDLPQSPTNGPAGPTPPTTNPGPVPAPTEPQSGPGYPAWLPQPVPALGKGDRRVEVINTLFELQDRRARATLHKHPYPESQPDRLPAPLKLIAKGEGTQVHEGFHRFDIVDQVAPGTVITRLDRNAAFLTALNTTPLPIGALVPADGPTPGRPGIYRLSGTALPTYRGTGPHPLGFIAAAREGSEVWIAEPTMELIRELVRDNTMDDPEITGAYLAEVIQPGKPTTVRLTALYEALKGARETALTHRDDATLSYLKMLYSVLVSTAGESIANRKVWRPDLPVFVRSKAFANVWRAARRAQESGLTVVALKNNDEIHIVGTPEDVFAATHPDGKPAFRQGTGLDEIKTKGTYRAGETPADEEDEEL